MANEVEAQNQEVVATKKKRSRRRRKPRSAKNNRVQPADKQAVKKHHDAPMTKRDLYFALHCEIVSIGHGAPAVARVTMLNWDAEVVFDTFVQVPVPVTDFRGTGIDPDVISTQNPRTMSFAKARQSVHQILKGKILIGYKLQEHLTALGLTHPSTDVRDAAEFRLFQYEEIDGVTDERVVVERHLADLCAEFLQREISITPGPMDSCTAVLDLYKAFRRDWENYLVQQAHEKENRGLLSSGASLPKIFSSKPPIVDVRPRPSSYDELSCSSFSSAAPPPAQERTSSWFSLGRSRQPYSSEVAVAISTQPTLTSEVLEMHDYSRNGAGENAEGSHHAYYWYPGLMHDSSSNPGSSSYYEDSSVISDSYASESVGSSLPEDGPQAFDQPVQQTFPSSWFRFGTRKPRYPQQVQKVPMSSLTEEADDSPGWPDQGSGDELRTDDTIAGLETLYRLSESEKQSNDEAKQPSSWFSFRRPKSPRPGKKQEDSGDEREAASGKRRRGSLSSNICDSILSVGRQSSAGSVGRRNSMEYETAQPDSEEQEKQTNSWFSFRRSTKSSTKRCSSLDNMKEDTVELNEQPSKRRSSLDSTKEDTAELREQPSLNTDTTDEDWMFEVLGSPNTQEKELLAVTWGGGKSIGLEVPDVSTDLRQSAKESKWLPRFLRWSKSQTNDAVPRADDMESSARERLLEPPVSGFFMDHSKMLNPSFFAQARQANERSFVPPANVTANDFDIAARSRLETESTLPTVASEAEDESCGAFVLDDSTQNFEAGMEKSFTYLNI